jgi:hypothetical protein
MPIDLAARLVETANKITTTRNEAGDIVYGSSAATSCLYRDISTLNKGGNREYVELDGYLWVGATETVVRGDIYYHSSEGYLRIEKVIRAKRLVGDNTTQFIKCEVTKQRQIS